MKKQICLTSDLLYFLNQAPKYLERRLKVGWVQRRGPVIPFITGQDVNVGEIQSLCDSETKKNFGKSGLESPCRQVGRDNLWPIDKRECSNYSSPVQWLRQSSAKQTLLKAPVRWYCQQLKARSRPETFSLFINIPSWSQFASLCPFSSSEWKFPGKPFVWMECMRCVLWE